MRFIFIFIDGIGIGEKNTANPFFIENAHILKLWKNSRIGYPGMNLKGIDALMGIGGIPQSATGQTSIFTGINVPGLLGKHAGSFPNKTLRKLIREENLLLKLAGSGRNARFINAYPGHSGLFSEKHVRIDDDGNLFFSESFPERYKKRISVTSSMIIANHTPPFDIGDMKQGRSLYQDFSNRSLLRYGLDLPELTPGDAAGILFRISGEYDFILYEFFQSDIFGHRKGLNEQRELIRDLDSLISQLTGMLNPETDTLLVTSDHGNLEDSTHKGHTVNPVPLLTWGRKNNYLQDRIDDISGITPAVLDFMTL